MPASPKGTRSQRRRDAISQLQTGGALSASDQAFCSSAGCIQEIYYACQVRLGLQRRSSAMPSDTHCNQVFALFEQIQFLRSPAVLPHKQTHLLTRAAAALTSFQRGYRAWR